MKINKISTNLDYYCSLVQYIVKNMKLIIFLKISKKDFYLKKDTTMCDSFEIDCIEALSLYTYLIHFTDVGLEI